MKATRTQDHSCADSQPEKETNRRERNVCLLNFYKHSGGKQNMSHSFYLSYFNHKVLVERQLFFKVAVYFTRRLNLEEAKNEGFMLVAQLVLDS